MELHTLEPAFGSTKSKKRKGRGQGSGKGGTSTKGHKGAQSRSGYKTSPFRTSGYTPLQRSKPKFGFKNPTRKEIQTISLGRLQSIADKHGTTDITYQFLLDKGIVKKNQDYKILAQGTITQKLHVEAPLFSLAAKATVEKLGGTIQIPQAS